MTTKRSPTGLGTSLSHKFSAHNRATTCFLVFTIAFMSLTSDSSYTVNNGNKKCLLRGECGEASNIVGDVVIPCHDPHEPHTINDTDALETLYEICPELAKDSDNPLVCCGADQINAMYESFQLPMQLGLSRCPSCLHNWRMNFCQMTCSPHQADFIDVTGSEVLSDSRLKVVSVNYHISTNYSDALYKSCQGVQGPATGTFILDFMCGSWGVAECTGSRWLEFMGKSIDNDGQAPFQINYKYYGGVDGPIPSGAIRPMDVRTFKCSEAPDADSQPCSCSACDGSCKLGKFHY